MEKKFALKELSVWTDTIGYDDPCSTDNFRFLDYDFDNSSNEFGSTCKSYFHHQIIKPLREFCAPMDLKEKVRNKRDAALILKDVRRTLKTYFPDIARSPIFRIADIAINFATSAITSVIGGPFSSLEEANDKSELQQAYLSTAKFTNDQGKFQLNYGDSYWLSRVNTGVALNKLALHYLKSAMYVLNLNNLHSILTHINNEFLQDRVSDYLYDFIGREKLCIYSKCESARPIKCTLDEENRKITIHHLGASYDEDIQLIKADPIEIVKKRQDNMYCLLRYSGY